MPLGKIDSNDLTVQLESSKADVWVPDGIAISKRSLESHELVPANTMAATSLAKDEHTKFINSNEWVFSFAGQQTKKPQFLDARVSGGGDNSASISKDFGRDVGPIVIQNKIPIPVSPGMQVSMAGIAKIRRTGLVHKIDDNSTPVLMRFDLWAAGYEEDEYGEETDIKLNLMAFTQSLQNISGIGSSLITYTLPTMDYVVVPQGCDRIFLTVSYVAANNSEYTNVSYNSEGGGGFFTPRYEAPVNFAYLPITNPLRILTKQSDSSSIVLENTLSKTGAAFKNRPFFENVFPLFDYINVQNSGFANDFNNWEAVGTNITISTDTPHTDTKCVKVVNSGQLMGPALAATAGEKIYMSAWMRNINFSGPGGLRIQKRVGSTWSDIASGSVTTANSQWIKTEIKATVPSDAEAIRLRLAFAGTGTLYFDDVEGAKLVDDSELTFMGEALPPTQPPPVSVPVPNGDFELGTAGWAGFAGTDTINSGRLQFSGNGTKSEVYSADPFVVVPGGKMNLEAQYAKITTYTGSGKHIFGGIFFSADNPTPKYVEFLPLDVGVTKVLGSYETISTQFTVPSGKDRMRLFIRLEAGVTGGQWRYDNFKLTDLLPPKVSTPKLGANIEIYEWNGSRGALIKTSSVAAGERKTIDVSSTTGMIEVVKPGAVTPADMGVNKSGDQVIVENEWAKVTGFSVRPDMLGTNLSDNNLVMNFAGSISVTTYIKFKGDAGKHEKGVRVLKNGVLINNATFTTKFETTGMSGKTALIPVSVGDQISFEAFSDIPDVDQRTVTAGTHFEVRYSLAPQSGNDFYVESLLAKQWSYLDQTQNLLESIQYTNIVDDVSSISIERIEADAGTMTLKFCSDDLDPRTSELLQIGKQIRILARHYGINNSSRPPSWVGESLYETVCVAKIKRIEVTYDYENEPQITVTAYDAFQKMDSAKLNLAFDTFPEYGPALNNTGLITKIDDTYWTGPQGSFPSELKYFPSTYGSMSLMDALVMTRNTTRKYLWVNKNNELIIKSSLDNIIMAEFTDGTIAGDLSMGNVKQGIDTETIVNAIDVEENLLDRSSFTDRDVTTATPPEMLKTIEGKQRTVRYQDNASIAAFGEYSKKFQVVRGTGSYEDLKNDYFGDSFIDWAEDILKVYSVPRIYISEMTSPVKDSKTMFMLAKLEILDRIFVHYQFDTFDVRIKSIKINITPGKWFYTFGFLPKSDQTYW